MTLRIPSWGAAVVFLLTAAASHAATIAVPAGGGLQAALAAAQPGDVITFVLSFDLVMGRAYSRRSPNPITLE
jgi:hypothetical protein